MNLSQKIEGGRWISRFQPTFPILALMLSLTLSVRAPARSCRFDPQRRAEYCSRWRHCARPR